MSMEPGNGGIHGEVHWDDGTVSEVAFSRRVNGHDRRAKYALIDGELFEGAGVHVTEHLHGGVRYAIDYDGQRWTPAPRFTDSCEVVD